jgi:CDP-paratose 2-epimerase
MTRDDRTLITGGAGFVGTSMAARLARDGGHVVILDDLSRRGVRKNLRWLREHHRNRLTVHEADVRDPLAVREALAGADRVFHFAAQVAVTTSVTDPRHDFGVNLGGTVNLLEELRRLDNPPPLLFTSTNKVYGDLDDVTLVQANGRYEPDDAGLRAHGISESRPLAFCSPYGCSKGGADQYVIDYAKSYGLPAVVFRMSCIYGPHQQGNEDQGWVAHFVKQAMHGEPITLYGDGRQVRDVLYIDDLLDAMLLAVDDVHRFRGHAFNMGGGPASSVSLLELLDVLSELCGRETDVEFGPWRVGDQRWYVSDTRAFQRASGWAPRVGVAEGIERLYSWLRTQDLRLTVVEAS